MAIAETAARKLLRGDAIARGVSFGLWDLVTGFFANILSYLFAALAGVAHLLVLPLELLLHWLVTLITNAAGAIASGLDGLWQLVTGFFAGIFAALASVPHLLVLPLMALWRWLVTIVADAAGAIGSGLDGLWHLVTGFFAGVFAGLASAAHQLVLPLETLWQWLATTAANAACSISSGVDGLWQLVIGFFPGILAHLSAAVVGLTQQLESLWQWLVTNVAHAAGAISSGLDSLWQLVAGFFPKILAHILAAVSGAAHEIPGKLEELWRWVKAAAVVALPFVVGIAVILLLVALVRFWGPALCAAVVGGCALVYAVSYLGNVVLTVVTVSVAGVLSCLLHPWAQCLHVHLHVVSMSALSALAVRACQALVKAFSDLMLSEAAAAPSPCPARLPPPRPATQPLAVAAEEEDGERVSLMAALQEQSERQWSDGAVAPREEKLELVVVEEDDTEAAGEEGVVADCCCVCMAQAKDAAFVPCGHTLCRDCARKLLASRGLCPLCNAAIDGVLDIF
ncbi:hypothetical protein HU200_051870 [Digitaria exilis]|uniref:RING-type domain-containing protein n=1 Tax=Digitaria exilis TaxID=1010633 RepID=A0A835E4I1_9POAL|nr:hypothetical protein HU200_051870 [Digitaria exilis]CAB3454907.1 unnamed protein product [Digitaria exilis]